MLFDQEKVGLPLAAAAVVADTLAGEAGRVEPQGWTDPFARRDGWRSHGLAQRSFDFEFHGESQAARLTYLHAGGLRLAVGAGDDPALPVVLGWSPSVEEAPAAPTGAGAVTAWLQPTDGTGEADTDRTDDVVPQVRTADLIQHVDQDLYGAYAVLDPDRTDPLEAAATLEPADLEELPPPAGGTGLRNLLYALEWVVFAAFAAFVWWRYVRDVTRRRDEEDAAEEPASDTPVPSGT